MKLKSLIVALFVSLLATPAFAQWFPAQVQASVLPGQVAFVVANPSFQPVICNGQVFGQTTYGQIFTTYFVEQYMPAGAFRYAYVVASPYAPFLSGWANINCRYTW